MTAIQYNDDILLAIFEKFLKNPHSLTVETDRECDLDAYIPSNEEYKKPNDYDEREWRNLLRWHVVVFVREFIIGGGSEGTINPWAAVPTRITYVGSPSCSKYLTLHEPMDYLNRSGQALYQELKSRHDKKQQ